MITIRRVPPLVLALVLVLGALVAAIPLTGAKGGNSLDAKACQKGGWEQLATADERFTPFADQDACVAAAAHGSTLAPLVTTSVQVSLAKTGITFMGRPLCLLTASFVNPAPEATGVSLTVTFADGSTSPVALLSGGQALVFGDTDDNLIADAIAIAQPGDMDVPVTVVDTCHT